MNEPTNQDRQPTNQPGPATVYKRNQFLGKHKCSTENDFQIHVRWRHPFNKEKDIDYFWGLKIRSRHELFSEIEILKFTAQPQIGAMR